ncbi:hypothetical protein KL864_31235 [Mycolicibacterium goodii]|uniref:hypothetical protein n=1 Tax=Mycolicibacterium goodii TaxID=134601 RepID=UPI001BDD6ADC|nr:hypothetical protein [Mycolicibacterium goodii]MBU8820357.1 hypothetical protein [Mycolicibacterium goodii]
MTDIHEAHEAYLARIVARHNARLSHLESARAGAEAIGRDVVALRSMGMSVSEIARRVGIPRPTLNDFMGVAVKSRTGEPGNVPIAPLPVLSPDDLVTVAQTGGPVAEIVASFDADTLFLSGEPFGRFVNPSWGSGMRIPHLMIRLEEAGWVGVSNVNVGYGGTGPTNAHRALIGIGIDDDVADEIAFSNRVSHVQFDDDGNPKFLHDGGQGRRRGLSVPEAFGENFDRFRIRMLITDAVPGFSDGRRAGADIGDGLLPSGPDDLPLWRRWINYLDDPPSWLAPAQRRHGTLFTSPQAADNAGFNDLSPAERAARRGPVHVDQLAASRAYQLIIEQGAVQLWIAAYISMDPSVWVPREFHDVLLAAGLLPEAVVEADEASTLRKFISRHRNRRPASVPLGFDHATLP